MPENVRYPFFRQGYRTTIILSTQFVIIATIAIIVAYVVLPKIEPVKQGYTCNDPSLMYKYHENTIDISVVHLVGYFFLLVTIFLIECQPWLDSSNICNNDANTLNKRLISSLYALFASQLGLVMNFLLYNLVKYSCGRLRPHFFDVCKPNECKTGTYVDSYSCTGTDLRLIRDAHLSFYSGHASTAFYYASFLIVYTQLRLRKRLFHCLLTLYFVNVLWFAAASFVSLSRIADNKHHNSDVVFGFVIGTAFGVTIVFVYLRELLHRINVKKPYVAPENAESIERRRFQASHINETA